MIFPNIDPYVFGLHYNGFGVRWYALAYVAGILLGWWYAIRLARREALWGARTPVMSREQIDDLVLWMTIGIIGGGRIGSMIFYNTSALWEQPLEIFKIWKGGMSFHGGLIGVAIAMVLFARGQKLPLLRISDLVAPCVPIGLFFGRIANFINGELWGRATNVPWGFYTNPAEPFKRHPSQLYEAALEGLALFIILRLATHRFGQLKHPGRVTGLFLGAYGVFRIASEAVREPDVGLGNLLGLNGLVTMGMILSIPMIIAGVWLWVKSRPETVAVQVAAAPEAVKAAPAAQAATPPKVEAQKPKTAEAKTEPKVATPKAAPKAAAKPKPAAPKTAKAAAKPAKAPAAKPATAAKPKAPTARAKPKPKP